MIEILSPAGGYESVVAAAENGANAVYLGQKRFSARAGAHNFTTEELKQAVEYCHVRGIQVHQALNTIVFDEELEEVADAIRTAAECGVDALIVQDLGVMRLCRELCPKMPLHASTQLSVHSLQGALLMQKLGFSRVVLSRELSFEEIRRIVENIGIETEVFVHGALCMSLSGQCYMSAMIGSRSANRGGCAGTCRMPFTATGKPDHCLSLKDACLTDYVRKLEEIGVTSMKIEGRMKRPEYTAAATAAFSHAVKGEDFDREQLQSVFSRSGFTDGYITGNTGPHMFGTRQKEDVVAAAPSVLNALQNTYKKVRSVVKVDISLHIPSEGASTLTMTDGVYTVAVNGEAAQPAINKPLDAERAAASLSKLGGTIFYAGEVSCDIAEGMTLPASALNAMRREASEKLYAVRAQTKPKAYYPERFPQIEKQQKKSAQPLMRLQFSSVAQMDEEVFDLPYDIILPCDEIIKHWDKLEALCDYLIAAPERALFANEEKCRTSLEKVYALGVRRMMVSNPAHLNMGKELGFYTIGDSFLNISNSIAASEWANAGLNELTLSAELTFDRAQKLCSPVPTGFIAYGHYPVMLTRNCPVKASVGCHNCDGRQKLTDRTKATFPVICHNRQWNEILNGKPILLSDRMKEAGFYGFMTLSFTVEHAKECLNIIEKYEQEDAPEHKNFTRGLYYRGVE